MSDARRKVPTVPGRALDSNVQASPELGGLAQQYDALRTGKAAEAPGSASGGDRPLQGLIIFASLGMPKASLDRLVADAEKARAVLVLRGMHGGSMQATKARIQELSGARQVGWQIDPTLFERFKVSGVPTIVLIDPARPVDGQCGTAQCQQPAFSKVVGDVSIAFALSDIARRDPEFAALARRFAASLGGIR